MLDGILGNLLQQVQKALTVRWTPQLQDFLEHVTQIKGKFELITRKLSNIAPEIQDLVDAGKIILRKRLP